MPYNDVMSSARPPSEEHQVGVTNAQQNNPDPTIADLTRRMNTEFGAGRYTEAGGTALKITALSRDELLATFERHGVTVLHLDHEAFGIYAGQIEPTYDVHVDGRSEDVLAANFTVPEAVRLAELIRQIGFAGATFSPKGQGTKLVYHTDTLRMTPQDFEDTSLALLEELVQDYPRLNFSIQRFVIYMPRL